MGRKRSVRFVSGAVILLLFLSFSYFIGFTVGQETPKVIQVRGLANLEDGKPKSVDFGIFWQAWDLLNREYLKHDQVGDQKKVYGAVKGLVQSLDDPYTQYLPPADNTRFQEDVQGSFGGIGAELGMRDGRLLIITPIKNSPAARAGLLPGDQIVKINTTSTESIQIDEAINFIRGLEKTTVTLSIFRKDWSAVKDITLKREKIELPTIDAEVISENLLYIQLHSFNGNSGKLLAETLQKHFSTQAVGGIILDLRNNPGGYLEMAVTMANWFLPKGTLVVTEQGLEHKKEFKAEVDPPLGEVPVVVLINKGSASAAEILAGALHDHKRAELVGEQSFGKGTVQELKELKDGSAIKLTIAHWVLPSGKVLEGNGIKPDYEVSQPEAGELAPATSSKPVDKQLEKAIEVLKKKVTTLFRSS